MATSEKRSTLIRARNCLIGLVTDKLLIKVQIFLAATLLWACISQSVAVGSFPPKKVDDPQTLLLIYGIFSWCFLAVIAGIAILCKKSWGWWLELAIFVPVTIVVIAHFWQNSEIPPSTPAHWARLILAALNTFVAIHFLREFNKRVQRETNATSL